MNSTSLEFLSLADKQEKDYNWLASAQTYSEFLTGFSEEEPQQGGIIHEQCGYAFYRAAMQANGQEEFSSRMTRATSEVRNALRLFRKANGPEERARGLRCKGMVSHVRYWLTSDVGEKKRLVNDSWSIAKDSLEAFQTTGNGLEFGRTYNQLSSNAFLADLTDQRWGASAAGLRKKGGVGNPFCSVRSLWLWWRRRHLLCFGGCC